MTCARTVLRIELPTITRNASGGKVITWSTFGTYFGRVQGVKGRESTSSSDGDQVAALETWLIKIDFVEGITAKMRLIMDGQTLNIRSAMDREKQRRILTIEAESGVAI